MKQCSLQVAFIIVFTLMFVVGMVLALEEGTGVSPQAITTVSFPDQRQAVKASVNWLVTVHQNNDGGYSNFSTGANQAPSAVAGTLDAILAIAAGGYNPAANYPSKTSNPITFLQNNATDVATYAKTGGGPTGKVILGLTAANQDPRSFMDYNFVISLTAQLSPTGQYNANTAFDQSLALLAMAAVGETTPVSTTEWLKDQQAANGSWNDGFGTSDNVDATGMAIMALVVQGEPRNSSTLINATDFLASAQLPGGGWEYGPGFGGNANSTALALQALSALGEDFSTTGGSWAKNGNAPLSALLSYQGANGAFQADFGFGPFDDFFTTVQAIPAVTGKPYPLPARYEAARQAIGCLASLQDPTTGGWAQFAGFGVNAAGTSRAIEAIAAFGGDPQSDDWTPGSVNALAALEDLTPAYLAGGRGGRVGVVMQGAVAGGAPYTVTNFAGFNLPISVTNYLSPTGEYDDVAFGPVAHNEAMLGLILAGYDPNPKAVTWLQGAATNGSWGGADANGISINVLGRLNEAVPPGAFSNLHNVQQADGGWGFGGPASVNSTAEVVEGLIQNGDNPFAPEWSVVVSGRIQNPADVALQQQSADGCWPNLFGPGDDPFSTTDGILLLMADPEWPRLPSFLEYKMLIPIVDKQ